MAIKGALFLGIYALMACSNGSIDETDSTFIPSETEDPRISSFETSLKALNDSMTADAARWSIADRMKAYGVSGASVAIIQNGEIIWTKGYGVISATITDQVDAQTVFSAGSVSKLINATLVLRLVQEGHLNLDEDVNTYLTSWKVPDNDYTRIKKVTLRNLLSHTSGFSQHGFPDFQPSEKIPTALETLNGTGAAKHAAVSLMFQPGEKMDYSGGGITVSQVVVEDVTGLSYPEAAQKYVFSPLGMSRSTFLNPLPETHGNIAKAHDRKGNPRALPRGYETMPEMAASGLWTSAEDMAKFVLALLQDETFLSNELRKDMLTRVPKSWHGLGPRVNGAGPTTVFHHGGANNSYKSWMEGQPHQGNGFVVLTNGEGGRRLAYELRIAAEEAFGWSVAFPDDFAEPEFQE